MDRLLESLLALRHDGVWGCNCDDAEAMNGLVLYAAQNAQIQSEALRLGEPTYLAQEEAANYERYIDEVIHRPWNMWIREVAE